MSEAQGQVEFTTPGTYQWIAPVGVTSVCVVAVGGGAGYKSSSTTAGGGGGLGWKNNIAVTPGDTYTVEVGVGGALNGVAGGDSYFIDGTTVKGIGATSRTGGSFLGDGGGQGGRGGDGNNPGGGGAGGYSGNGGNGGEGTSSTSGVNGASGQGGGAGGGSGYNPGGGGGVGIYGEGASGAGGKGSTDTSGNGGKGGSGGSNGANYKGGTVGLYGAGAGKSTKNNLMVGGGGAVRIIWGPDRSFPSTKTDDQPEVIVLPTNIRDTDLFLLNGGSDNDFTKSYKCQAINLVSYPSNYVLVLEDDGINPPTSFHCALSKLADRITSNHWMLVNRGAESYKVQASEVVQFYGPFIDYVPVDKPSNLPRIIGQFTTSLASSQSSGFQWRILLTDASVTTLDYLYHVGVTPGSDSGYVLNTGKGEVYYSNENIISTITTGNNWDLSLYRSSNQVLVSDFSTNGRVTFQIGYPPGSALADESRSYAQSMSFCNTGAEPSRWISNEEPVFRLEGRDFSVDVSGLSTYQVMSIMVYPTAKASGTAEVLVDKPDAVKYATTGDPLNGDSDLKYFETPDAYSGTINFRSNSDWTWVVTQVINYAQPQSTYTPEQWRTYVEGLSYERLEPTGSTNRTKGAGNYWTDAMAASGNSYGSPRATNCDPESSMSRNVQHMVDSEAEFNWLVANDIPIIWIVGTGGTATSFLSYTFNGWTSQAFNDGTAYPRWRNIECQWLREDGQVWRRFGCTNSDTTGTLERISPFDPNA